MRIKIRLKIEDRLVLPISYNHILQAAIYNLGRGCDGTLHDYGYGSTDRQFKLFCFSQLSGKYRVRDKKITFYEHVTFEIGSMDEEWLGHVAETVIRDGMQFGNRTYAADMIRQEVTFVRTDEVEIRMLSPVTVHTRSEEGETIYYRPDDKEFSRLINANLFRKYEAAFGTEPERGVEMEILRLEARDKCVTTYKGIYITAWNGIYRLRSAPVVLNFLYDTGLGSNSSQGFGLFEIL